MRTNNNSARPKPAPSLLPTVHWPRMGESSPQTRSRRRLPDGMAQEGVRVQEPQPLGPQGLDLAEGGPVGTRSRDHQLVRGKDDNPFETVHAQGYFAAVPT